MASYFVTATGTDVGKTFVTAGLLRALGPTARALKPVLSGYDPADARASDPGHLLAAMNQPVTEEAISAISPWRFRAPLAPDMAAAREGAEIPVDRVIAFCRHAMREAGGKLLIEGVGGVAVPLDETHLVTDWILLLQCPALLVAGTYLGSISHTLTAAAFLAARGIEIAALVLSESAVSPVPPEQTAASLARFLPETAIHIIPRQQPEPSLRALAAAL